MTKPKTESNGILPLEEPYVLPLLVMSSTVMFPEGNSTLQVGYEKNLKLFQDYSKPDSVIALAWCHMDGPNQLDKHPPCTFGVEAKIIRLVEQPPNILQVFLEGSKRISILKYLQKEPYLTAEVAAIVEQKDYSEEAFALVDRILENVQKLLQLEPKYSKEFYHIFSLHQKNPGRFADIVASSLHLELRQKQKILETVNWKERLKTLLEFVEEELQRSYVSAEISDRMKIRLEKSQKEQYLREQLKVIKTELGEEDLPDQESARYKKEILSLHLPAYVEKKALWEAERLKMISTASAEYGIISNYLDCVISLPWNKQETRILNTEHLQKVLNEGFWGLPKAKERVIEHLSLKACNPDYRGHSLCFVGPPGIGKRILGELIAKGMQRKFIRFSVNGIKDASEIWGQKPSLSSTMPGIIIRSLIESRTKNPVMMIENIDKLGSESLLGGPASALMEVLNPKLNSNFRDRFLDFPFDLSEVTFLTSANNPAEIPEQLQDFLEFIEIPSLIEDEKIEVMKHSLIPKQLASVGLSSSQFNITDDAIKKIIRNYSQEAGIKELQRQLIILTEKCARQQATGQFTSWNITPENISEFLGAPVYFPDQAETEPEIGVAVGLTWTEAGGDILVVEALKMPGSGNVISTGSIGDVMRESVAAAHSFVRSKAQFLGINYKDFTNYDIHIHFPSGAIPKEGPSAGITISLVIASVLSDRPIRNDIGLTGEVSLRGRVLPIGGVKEKVIAAYRSGLKKVILPKENDKDLPEIPEEIRKKMKFIFVQGVEEVFEHTLLPKLTKKQRKSKKKK